MQIFLLFLNGASGEGDLIERPCANADTLFFQHGLEIRALHTNFFSCLCDVPVVPVQRTQKKGPFQRYDRLLAQQSLLVLQFVGVQGDGFLSMRAGDMIVARHFQIGFLDQVGL